MTNHYAFTCPVRRAAAEIGHCEEVHSAAMKGRQRDVEDKLCAVAHEAWICPFRNAVKYQGVWSTHDAYPRWDAPRAKPDTLPARVLEAATSRLPPRDYDYRRCGAPVGAFDEAFRDLNKRLAAVQVAGALDEPKGGGRRRSSKAKPEENAVAGALDQQQALSDALAKRLAQRDAQGAESPGATPDTRKNEEAPQRASQSPDGSSAKPRLSLAERARLMKERAGQ